MEKSRKIRIVKGAQQGEFESIFKTLANGGATETTIYSRLRLLGLRREFVVDVRRCPVFVALMVLRFVFYPVSVLSNNSQNANIAYCR